MPKKSELQDEIQKMAYEPLLPVEKHLIIWSLVIGLTLLGVLVWLSGRLFPG